jgi:tetrahydromethanopterin S-methyltransferase subunit A
MAKLGNLFIRFKKQIETSDKIADDSLKTHYYKAKFNQLFDSVEKLFHEDADCTVTTVSKERGEIAVEISKPISCFLIVTIVAVRPIETAVDFNISSEKFSLTGSYPALKKRINSYYERINQLHTFVGIKNS